jgi:hypothetical protein
MKTAINSFTTQIAELGKSKLTDIGHSSLLAGLVAMLILSMPLEAMAQVINMPFIDGIGCQVANWMKGPLAVIVFILVIVATFIVGLITKMDWGKIITVAIVFGLIQGLVALLLSSGRITLPGCLTP